MEENNFPMLGTLLGAYHEEIKTITIGEPKPTLKRTLEWISVKDRLPEPFVDVLVSARDTMGLTYKIGEQYCAIDRFCIWTDGEPPSFRTSRFDYGIVNHWMPLPEIPNVCMD